MDGRACDHQGQFPAGCLYRQRAGKYNTYTYTYTYTNTYTYANSDTDSHSCSKGKSDAAASAYPATASVASLDEEANIQRPTSNIERLNSEDF